MCVYLSVSANGWCILVYLYPRCLDCPDGSTQTNDPVWCAEYFNLTTGCSDSSCDGITRCDLSIYAYTADPPFTSSTALCKSESSNPPWTTAWTYNPPNVEVLCSQCCNYCPTTLTVATTTTTTIMTSTTTTEPEPTTGTTGTTTAPGKIHMLFKYFLISVNFRCILFLNYL